MSRSLVARMKPCTLTATPRRDELDLLRPSCEQQIVRFEHRRVGLRSSLTKRLRRTVSSRRSLRSSRGRAERAPVGRSLRAISAGVHGPVAWLSASRPSADSSATRAHHSFRPVAITQERHPVSNHATPSGPSYAASVCWAARCVLRRDRCGGRALNPSRGTGAFFRGEVFGDLQPAEFSAAGRQGECRQTSVSCGRGAR